MTEELVAYEGGIPEMRVAREPQAVMADAEKAAMVLVSVVSRKPKKVMIGGEQYLEFEDWQTVSQFYGCTVRVSWTRFLDLGGVRGFEACAEVIDRSGRSLSAAEAMCLNDEERWSTRPKYEYQYILKNGSKQTDDPPSDMIVWEANPDKPGKNRPKKGKVLVGEEVVPLFQLRSMAQTRACAKALRNVFAWVVVLAGYRPTPAEEMTGNETIGKSKELPMPQPVATGTGSQSVTGIIQAVTSKMVKGKKGDWTKFGVQIDKEWYGTFDAVIGQQAQACKGTVIVLEWKQEGEYKTITAIGSALEPGSGAKEEPKAEKADADKTDAELRFILKEEMAKQGKDEKWLAEFYGVSGVKIEMVPRGFLEEGIAALRKGVEIVEEGDKNGQ